MKINVNKKYDLKRLILHIYISKINNMSNLIQSKYKPTKLDDIIGNTTSKYYIKNWLD